MLTNFSSSSVSLIKLISSRSPFSDFSTRNKFHLSKTSPVSVCWSFSSSNSEFHFKNQFLLQKHKNPLGRCKKLKTFALPGFESAQSVLEAVGVLTAIIIVHESGHFLAAYLQGIHVSKFAVGFGPVIAKFNAKDVEYSLRAFPLGGFVAFPDNDPASDIPPDDENLLKNRPIFDRIIVVSAGVIANIVFAYVIIFAQVVFVGLPVQEAFPGVLVPEVRPFSAASRDGLFPGDVILGVNGTDLRRTGPSLVSEVVEVIKKNPERKVLLRVGRGPQQDVEISITPDLSADGTGRIGVQLSPNLKISKVKPKDILEAVNYSGREFVGLTSSIVESLKQTFLNFSQSASNVSGPVAIIAVGAEVAKSNIDGLYQFAAALNINLAVINLLPLPALDGGTLALILIEAARGGRKLPLELEQRIMSSGIMLVLILGVFLLIRDTLNLDFIRAML